MPWHYNFFSQLTSSDNIVDKLLVFPKDRKRKSNLLPW